MPGDGNLRNNNNLYKSTGRYPTIPTVYALRDDTAKSFKYQLKQSQLGSRWSSISAKQNELNKVFPSLYSGNCYVANYNNSWVTYNPNKTGKNCGGVFDLKYNTSKSMDVNFNAYGNALITEYPDHIDIHTNNFDNKAQATMKTDTFKMNGCKTQPTYTAKDTGRNQAKSQISESYSNGTYTLTVKHNGPVDITIKCSGSETNRLINTPAKKVQQIVQPAPYTGTRQYEGEFFDLKNSEGYVGNACGSGVNNVQGLGFLKFGKNANSMAKDTVHTEKAGDFKLKLRYYNTSDINNVDLYVYNSKVTALKLSNTNGYSNWKTVEQTISLKQGDNRDEFKANGALSSSLYIDNFTVDGDFGAGTKQTVVVSEPEPLSGKLIKELKVNDTENASDWSICNNMNSGANVYDDRDITIVSAPTELANAEAIRTTCDSKLYTEQLASFTAGEDIAVYAAVDTRVSGRLDWLKNWTDTGAAVTTSNDVTLELFRTEAKSGTQVVLGTNGGDNESANYIVFAVPLAIDKPITTTTTSTTIAATTTTTTPVSDTLWGDANCDGRVTVADAVAILQFIGNIDKYSLTDEGRRNADVYNNGDGITARDALSIQMLDANVLASLPESYSPSATATTNMTTTTTTTMTAAGAAVIASNFNFDPDLQYKKAPDTYRKDCPQQGKVEKVSYKTTVYGNNIDKSAYVYLPYGYDSSKQYNIMYMMHGGGGNESSIFIESTVMKKYLDWMIMNKDIEPMIVVTPTFNNAAGSDMTANAKNFWNELAKDVIPAIESKYSTYAKNEYFLMCATGTKDIAFSAMNDQLNSMKKLTDTFTYTSDFSKGNLYFLLCDGGSHWWDGYIVGYIYDAMPYLFHE